MLGRALQAATLAAGIAWPGSSGADTGPILEPAGPQPNPEVQAHLQTAARLRDQRKPAESRDEAEKALSVAKERWDDVGTARAQESRAEALEALGLSEDAMLAWSEADAIWDRLAATPERIETLCARAALLTASRPGTVPSFVDDAIRLSTASANRPGAAMAALNHGAARFSIGQGTEAIRRLSEAALAIGERSFPSSLEVAASLHTLGRIAAANDDSTAAREYFSRALDIRARLAPESLLVASTLHALAVIAWSRMDLVAAQEYEHRALEIRERLAPGSLDVAGSLSVLGGTAEGQGELAAAREYELRALDIQERLAPGSLTVAGTLNKLGGVAYDQGDLAAARERFSHALEIAERVAPNSPNVAASLSNLGNVAWAEGDLSAARDYASRALEIRERQSSDLLGIARSLSNLGDIALSQKAYSDAKEKYLRALEFREKLAPGTLTVAASLASLGGVAQVQGDRAGAREYFQRALAIQRVLAPGSLAEARTLFALGELSETDGDRDRAAGYTDEAWGIVTAQRAAVTGDQAVEQFVSQVSGYAEQVVRTRFSLGRTSEALTALEEARAQGLLELLLERDVSGASIDPALWARYLAAEHAFTIASRQLADIRSDRTASSTSAPRGSVGAAPGATKEREAALAAYTRARVEKERLLRELRGTTPGLETRVRSAGDARRALPSRSVYVAWAIGDRDSVVFLIPANSQLPVQAKILNIDGGTLQTRVDALRRSIRSASRIRGSGGVAFASGDAEATAERTFLVSQSRVLFESLFPPSFRETILSAERLILSPDGPLWDLPFAALVTNSTGKPAWLGLKKPISYTPSLTVLAADRMRPRESARPSAAAVVVGDPAIVPSTASDSAPPGGAEPRSIDIAAAARLRGEAALLTSGGSPLPRLPASAEEARRVAALYGAVPLIGDGATESAVRRDLSTAPIIHLASHGLFHPKLGMSSGILLAAPAPGSQSAPTTAKPSDDDGVLQAWEFGRTLPLRAEIVVLSACETGRGQRVRGEGLIGLTRSIQAAGARSVVASQWAVADSSTADLMVAFHARLRQGVPRDEALRRAMLATERAEATKEPFYWAAFVLTGEADRPISSSVSAR